MSGQKQQDPNELKDYADGWMQERKGTDAPGFLKLVIPIIGLGCTAYLFLQIYGDTGHATRGPLVQQFNTVSKTSPVFSYAVGALALIYVVIVAMFAFSKPHED
jgi:Na+/H+ antiporter NhaC